MGMVVSDGSLVTLTANLLKRGEAYVPEEGTQVSYQWYKNSQLIPEATEQTLEVVVQFGEAVYNQYSCTVTVREKEE
jgi:hypothetical protein